MTHPRAADHEPNRPAAVAGGPLFLAPALAPVAALALVLFLAPALAAAFLAPAPALAATHTRFVSAHAAVAHYGPAARKRLAPAFRSAGVTYPPSRLVLAAIKGERALQVYAARKGALRYVTTYRILGVSGHGGPKLREGDCQVPEGVYRIKTLSANTAFHLAMLLDYPNRFDRAQARRDGRHDLGGGIYIHGSDKSTGCLAMGDRTAEDLFVLAADTGLSSTRVVISPSDPRAGALRVRSGSPKWTPALYRTIAREFEALPSRPRPATASAASATAAPGVPTASTTLPYAPTGSARCGVSAVVYVLLGGLALGAVGAGLLFWPSGPRRRPRDPIR